MKAQDIFGSSPKTVLNKPLFQVRNTTDNDVNAGETSSGWNDSTLTETPTNEITGASLVSDIITLPVGEYFIEGFVSGQSGSATLAALRDLSDVVLLQSGTVRLNTNNPDSGIMTMRGRLTVSAPIQIKVSLLTESGDSRGWGRTGNIGQGNIWTDICFWKLDENIETIVISDPQMTLARPLLHIQDQKPDGTAPQTLSAAAETQRDLTAVVTNEIAGATLNGDNTFYLPAGSYEVRALSPQADGLRTNRLFLRDAGDGTMLMMGLNSGSNGGTNDNFHAKITGRLTLTAGRTLKLMHYSNLAGIGGAAMGSGSPAVVEIYTDVIIHQLDTVVRTPVLVNDKLFPLPGSVQVVGNMFGLEYAKTAANEVTVEAGACMDSTNEFPLQHASAQAVSIPAVNDAMYHLFLCDDGFVRPDTDINGAGLSGYKIRWAGFVRNNATGSLVNFTKNGDIFMFNQASENILVDALVTAYELVDHSAFIPDSRVEWIIYGAQGTAVNCTAVLSTDGVNVNGTIRGATGYEADTGDGAWYAYGSSSSTGAGYPFAYKPGSMYFKKGTNAARLFCHSVKLKR